MIELTLETAGAPAFAGPLDLLLAIVRRNGYPLDRLPLAEITRQFTAYVQQSNEHMLELGSDFCETVSWLVLLKSRMLLPGHSEGREVAPEEELRRALVAHEQVQALSGLLEERLAMVGLGAGLDAGHAGRLKQQAVLETQRGEDAPRTTPTVQDALASARRAMASARAYAEAHVAAEPSLSLDEVLGRLQARVAALAPGQTVSTRAWFERNHSAEAHSLLVLALLELARRGRLWIYQPAPLAPLWVQRPPETGETNATVNERHPRKTAKRSRSSQRKVLAGTPL
jgi:chromatin segregation and condensation protein Rec8/ScpA/Scc1 (kleisin family)